MNFIIENKDIEETQASSVKIEKEVKELQKKLNIDSKKFLTTEEIIILHNQQQANLIKNNIPTSSATNKFQ